MHQAGESFKEESDTFYNNGKMGSREPYGPLRSFELQDKESNKVLEKLSVIFTNQNVSKKMTAKTKTQRE